MPAIPSSKDKIIDAAVDLFYSRGIKATSVDTIIQASGVHKSTFFKHFPSKADVVAAFLRRRDDNWMNWLIGRVDALGKGPEGRLLALFDAMHEWFEQSEFRGCAFINTVAESPDEKSIEFVLGVDHKKRLSDYVASLVRATGLKRKDVLVKEIMLLIEGSIVRAQMGQKKAAAVAKGIARLVISEHAR